MAKLQVAGTGNNASTEHTRMLSRTQATAARSSINTTLVIRILTQHVKGEVQLTATQLGAAKLLLDKAMPDSQLRLLGADREPVLFEMTISDAQVL